MHWHGRLTISAYCSRLRFRACSGAAVLAVLALNATAQTFQLTELTPNPGTQTYTYAGAISAGGQVAFTSNVSGGTSIYVYSAGVYAAPPNTVAGLNVGAVSALNDAGELVGNGAMLDVHNNTVEVGFTATEAGGLALLPSLPTSGGTQVFANGLNDAGQVVGASSVLVDGNYVTYPVLWQNGVPQRIGQQSGSAYGINDFGQITLGYDLYSQSQLVQLAAGYLGPDGRALNRAGQVAGTFGYNHHAFIYSNGAATDIGSLYAGQPTTPITVGLAINNAGQVVGYGNPGGDSEGLPCYGQAFLYSNATMTNLNALVDPADPLQPYVCLSEAVGINDSGQIIANGIDSRGGTYAYLLTPEVQFPSTVQLYAQPASAVTGVPLTVAWTDQSVSACSASGGTSGDGWAGALPSNGGQVQVTETAVGPVTYTITCSGLTAPVSSSATVMVALPPSVTLTASPTSVQTGQTVQLSWSSVSVTSCTAAGGSSTDLWHGNQPTSGSLSLIEGTAQVYPFALDCTYGGQTYSAQAPVTVSWQPVTVTLSAAPTAINLAAPTVLSWTSAGATDCTGSGGGASDGWPGTKGTKGSQSISEPYAPSGASLALSFTIVCSSRYSGQSAQASVSVVQTSQSTSSAHHGGGAFDRLGLIALLTVWGLRIGSSRRARSGAPMRPLAGGFVQG